jgi:hypothetical protein
MTHRSFLGLVPVLALVLVLVPIAAGAGSPVYPPRPLAGGWRTMSSHAPELRPVLEAALRAVPRRLPLRGVFRAERQVVAGINYRLTLVFADGGKWRVTVWRHLDGTMEATAIEPVP